MISKTIRMGAQDVRIGFGFKAIIDMEQTGWKIIGLKEKRRVKPEEILQQMDSMEVMFYLLEKGVDWPGSGVDKKDVPALFEAYMEDGDLDTGERYNALQETIAESLAAARGIDLKKAIAKGKEVQKETKVEELARIYEAKMRAEKRFNGETGTPPEESPLESE